MPRPPVPEETRLRMIELADDGLSTREIARELGIASSTVVRHARRMGLHFDRAATIAATAVRMIDAKARRAEEAAAAIAEAKSEREKLHQPCRVVGVVGGTNAGVKSAVFPRPPSADRRAIVANYSALIETHVRLCSVDINDEATDHARSLLGRLRDQLDRACEVDQWLDAMTNDGCDPATCPHHGNREDSTRDEG